MGNLFHNLLSKFLIFIENKLSDSFTDNCTFYNKWLCSEHFISNVYNDEFVKSKKHLKSFTRLELSIIQAFTVRGSLYINHSLAGPVKYINFHQWIIIKIFDNILQKIEKENCEFVYRKDTYSYYKEKNAITFFNNNNGNIIKIPWFLSTTKDPDRWLNSKIEWKIKLSPKTRAKKFYNILLDPSCEKEVRFERNTFFRIDRIVTKNEHTIINMSEVSETQNFIKMDYSKYS